jgi:hypothetical protein
MYGEEGKSIVDGADSAKESGRASRSLVEPSLLV